jgi:mannose-1-phosphate guanylyltransferase
MTAYLNVTNKGTKPLPVNAVLLAAGYGTRLKPFTNEWPKCLMPVHGVPLLGYWLQSIKEIGISKVIVNLHYLAPAVEAFLRRTVFISWVNLVYEPKLMGTAGTIRANYPFLADATLMLVHADNYCQCDFGAFLLYHRNSRPKHCLITMMTFDTPVPSSCGVVETDSLGVVTAFYEKVPNPPNNRANGAVYLIEPEVLVWLNNHPEIQDFSTQVLPRFLGKIATWHNDTVHIDIGSVESLLEAQQTKPNEESMRNGDELDEWEKFFSSHSIHQQIKSLSNEKSK